jgi:signal peptidase I
MKQKNKEKNKNPVNEKNKNTFQKIKYFLLEDNSILSWIVSFLLIFLIAKFIFMPLMGLILSTELPFVIIESGSMEHEGVFDSWYSLHGEWYIEKNISKEEISSWDWNSGLYKGDVIIIKGDKENFYQIGDVIVFKVMEGATPIIHRIINKTDEYYSTKGDHNDGQLSYEYRIYPDQIVGKAIVRIPKLGWPKLFLFNLFR